MVRSWDVARDLDPIDVLPVFAAARIALVELLRGLALPDWKRPTMLPGWTVHDIALHLLGNDLGRLRDRSGESPRPPERDFEALAARIEASNERWVTAARRIPPALVVEWLAMTGPRVDRLFASLDPWTEALTPVLWTGTGPSPAWLDIAREYTDHWMHHQQIRLAVEQPGMTERRWLYPVIDAFMRALPRAYETTEAVPGARVVVRITGPAEGTWSVERGTDRWKLLPTSAASATAPYADVRRPDAEVRIPDDLAWRLLTRLVSLDDVDDRVVRVGDPGLTAPALNAVAVMTTQPG